MVDDAIIPPKKSGFTPAFFYLENQPRKDTNITTDCADPFDVAQDKSAKFKNDVMKKITSIKVIQFLLVLLFFLLTTSVVYATDQLETGTGNFIFIDFQSNQNKPITVWYYKPEQLKSNTRVLFVMHGVKRNAKEYRDAWVEYAEKHKFLLLVPEFSKKHYPTSREYNLGNMFS